jgi:hypothetical protein
LNGKVEVQVSVNVKERLNEWGLAPQPHPPVLNVGLNLDLNLP